nr:uncharacterized protein LOC105883857 [Microcebus murinus]
MPQVLVASGAQDTSLDEKPKGGCGPWHAGSEACEWGWHLLSQGWASWQEGPFSLQHAARRRGGWEGSQRSFPLSQRPSTSQRSSPEGLSTSMWCWPPCRPTCTPPSTVGALCSDKKGALVVQMTGWGAPVWPGLQLPWVSNVLSSAPAHSAPTPPRGTVARSAERTHRRPVPGRQEEGCELLASALVRNIASGQPARVRPCRGWAGGGSGWCPRWDGRRRPQTESPRLLLPRRAQGLGRPHVCSHPRSPAATAAATWEPARAHGPLAPAPTSDVPWRQAGTPRLAGEATLPPPRTPLPQCPRAAAPRGGREGEGRRRLAVALLGSATPLLWQPFPSEVVAARARLWLPRSPSLRCGLGEGLPAARAGVRAGDPGPGRRAAHSRGFSPGTVFRPRSVPARPAAAETGACAQPT